MSKQNLDEFLEILDSSGPKSLKVEISSKKSITVTPLSFKQQKSLITTGMDGFGGVMMFIKTLNDIILYNTKEDDLKIFDRVPIALAMRAEMSEKPIIKDDIEIQVSALIKQFKKIEIGPLPEIMGDGYSIMLKIPSLKEENRMLSTCIEDIKKLSDDNIGKNISVILSYEVPKFIDTINFNGKILCLDDIPISDKMKIMNNLPANITNRITDFILKVREYDEQLLTINGISLDINPLFFE